MPTLRQVVVGSRPVNLGRPPTATSPATATSLPGETSAAGAVSPTERVPRSKSVRGGFALEAIGIYLVLYPLFSWARGLVAPSTSSAFRNAEQIIDLERTLGIYWERTIQQWSLPYGSFVGFWNIWYGSVHFVGPVAAMALLYHFQPARYLRWRNTFLWMLLPVLVGFWFYPLMPPRLLPATFGFVDTRLLFFTIGKPGAGEEMRYALSAMPSMHIAFASWASAAVWPLARRRSGGLLLLVAAYPFVMVFATVVTGNHYFLDAVGGVVALGIGYALARWRDWWPGARQRQRVSPPDAVRSASEVSL